MVQAASPVSQSQFIRDVLTERPQLRFAELNQIWRDAGNEKGLNESTYYTLKKKLQTPNAPQANGVKPSSAKPADVSPSELIRDVLKANPNATIADVRDAWKKAGRRKKFQTSLFYQQKKKLGLSVARKPKKAHGGMAAAPAAQPTAALPSMDGYASVEALLDRCLPILGLLGDNDVYEAVLVARRKVGAKLL